MRQTPQDHGAKARSVHEVERQVERALSLAEQVLERPAEPHVFELLIFSECVLSRLAETEPAALREARGLVEHARRLRAVLAVLEQRIDVRAMGAAN